MYVLHINLPETFSINKLSVSYSDGIKTLDLSKEEIRHKMVIKGELHSLYGSVTLRFDGDSLLAPALEIFFFSEGNSSIDVLPGNILRNARLVNASNARDKGKEEMDNYFAKEQLDMIDYLNKYGAQFGENRSLFEEGRKKAYIIYKKQLEFVATNPALFHSFWTFHQVFLNIEQFVSTDSLITIYQQFPDSYKTTAEGKYMLAILDGRYNVNDKLQAADFRTVDIKNDTVSLDRLKGKYIILDFWATWCTPCMKQMPRLIEISQKYPVGKVQVVSITLDRDSLAYSRVLQKLPTNWLHIYGDKKILNSYGVSGIPVFYLIGPDGKILFKNKEGLDEDYIALDKVLEERLQH
jgi:thiol-disulfide isomerase/thioredoxin